MEIQGILFVPHALTDVTSRVGNPKPSLTASASVTLSLAGFSSVSLSLGHGVVSSLGKTLLVLEGTKEEIYLGTF